MGGSCFCLSSKKRSIIKSEEKFLLKNGTLQHRNFFPSNGKLEAIRIFTEKELQLATDSFRSQIIGRGAYGTLYKGALLDDRTVTILKPQGPTEMLRREAVHMVAILSQINHKNVVKLLGCCLQTSIPLVVYEFVPKGSLYWNIHDTATRISWQNRLKIAVGIAEGLAYLHTAGSIPIIHRDVKSSNVLLEDDYTPKVSNFALSRSAAMDNWHTEEELVETIGYMDPESFGTMKLTAKSDVYSFGVVLLELLTGKKPVGIIGEGIPLVPFFISSMEEKRPAFEVGILEDGKIEQLQAVAELAMKCLQEQAEGRPTMKEVAQELEKIKRSENHL